MSAPSTPDLTLTQPERQRFNTAVTNAGLDPSASWSNVINVTSTGPISSNYVTTKQVTSLNQLNQIIGLPDSIFQASGGASLKAAPIQGEVANAVGDPKALAAALSYQDVRHLKWAADLHLFGDNAPTASNEALIDAVVFPITLTIVAAQSLTLAPNVTLQFAQPAGAQPGYVLLILGSLSIGAGAQISSTENTVINAQVAFSAND